MMLEEVKEGKVHSNQIRGPQRMKEADQALSSRGQLDFIPNQATSEKTQLRPRCITIKTLIQRRYQASKALQKGVQDSMLRRPIFPLILSSRRKEAVVG
jgi:hypothetical protein